MFYNKKKKSYCSIFKIARNHHYMLYLYLYIYSDIQDEFHITLCCVKFKSLREKYIKPYYYRRPSMQKFVELMNTDNRRDLHRLMIFLKLLFKLYMDTLLE